jgi:hypothetical protein
MSRVFAPLESDISEAAKRHHTFLRGFLFDKTCTDEVWDAAMQALFLLFGQQLLRSGEPVRSIDNAIEMLKFMREKVPS